MNKYLLFLIPLFTFQLLSAQSLQINGNIVMENTSTEGARIIIYKNNIKLTEQDIPKKGRFDFKLALDSDYKISFEKDGYVTKNVSVNTEVPSEIIESSPNFPPVKLIINLLPKVQNVDLSIFDQPVAILAYNHELDDFTFDKEYSDRIRDKVAQAEQNIKRTLAQKGSEALKKEQMIAELIGSGQRFYDQKKWTEAIGKWNEVLAITPTNDDIKTRIELAKKEEQLEKARQSVELQNERAYKLLVASADSLFNEKKWTEAKNSYTEAIRLNNKDAHPPRQINEINRFLAEEARQLAENQKNVTALENNYKQKISIADNLFNSKEYKKSITAYQEASTLKPTESYPKEMIGKAEKALAAINQEIAAKQEKEQVEAARRMALQNDYNRLIADADAAFKVENYALAKLRYTEADALALGEEYPKKQLAEIENVINSSKYKARLADFNRNKTMAEKALQEKNYASAKFYYQKAINILPIDKENINQQINNIDKQIEAEQLAAILKKFNEQMEKAEKAYKEKAYAVAKFYYQKALEIKVNDKYAQEKLQEVEKYINSRQEKGAEL